MPIIHIISTQAVPNTGIKGIQALLKMNFKDGLKVNTFDANYVYKKDNWVYRLV